MTEGVIHPTALIDPSACLGEGVTVGAYSVIGAGVAIGARTWIGPHAVINGPTCLGPDNRVFQFASIGEAPQDLKYAGEPTRLEVGSRNIIREFVTMSRGTTAGGGVTRVGDDNLFMAYVHIAHDCQVGSHTVFANNASLAGHVTVGDHAILGGFTGIHQFCRVGAHCMTGIASIALHDIPPFLLVYENPARPFGLNLRGLKRRGFTAEALSALKEAYRLLYRSGLRLEEAIEKMAPLAIRHEAVGEFVAFVASSQRGIIR